MGIAGSSCLKLMGMCVATPPCGQPVGSLRPPRHPVRRLSPYWRRARQAFPDRAGPASHGHDAPRGIQLASLAPRSEEHTSELQSLMRISYAVFCLKKKKKSEYTIIQK